MGRPKLGKGIFSTFATLSGDKPCADVNFRLRFCGIFQNFIDLTLPCFLSDHPPPLLSPRYTMVLSSIEPSASTNSQTSSSDMTSNKEIIAQQLAVAKTVLLQAVDLLDNHLVSDQQLTVQSQFMPGSTIGKHLRHARDHFALLITCILAPPPRVLSYDTRIRATPMETSRAHARIALMDTIKQLEKVIPTVNFQEQISLHAVTPHLHTFQTTIGRELWFTSLHCVHHWSMVRVIAGELGVKLTEDFGFAPSTLVYQDREAPLGKGKL